MSTFILKRKTFDDNSSQGNSNSNGLGKKIVAGTALAAGTFLGAKKGMFGGIGRMASGRIQMGAGNLLKNKNIFSGGAKTYGKGYASEVNKVAFGGKLNKSQMNKAAVITKNNLMNNFNSGKLNGSSTLNNNLPTKIY